MSTRLLLTSSASALTVSVLFVLAACEGSRPGGASGHSGAGGAGGGCPESPQPIFTVTITASDGPLPSDTRLAVTWSAGAEPVFALDEPDTWMTLDQGSNVVCDVSAKNPPSDDLAKLVCRLWTSGATEVVVSAESYQSHIETLLPLQSEHCKGPIPKEVEIQLLRETDAGAPP